VRGSPASYVGPAHLTVAARQEIVDLHGGRRIQDIKAIIVPDDLDEHLNVGSLA